MHAGFDASYLYNTNEIAFISSLQVGLLRRTSSTKAEFRSLEYQVFESRRNDDDDDG